MTDTTPVVGLAIDPDEVADWLPELTRALASLPVRFDPEAAPGDVTYLVYNIDSGLTDFAAYPQLRVILNTWAGVEAVVGKVHWPAHVSLCRMVEPGLTDGMVEYFTGHVMRYHLDIDRFQADSAAGRWEKWWPPLAHERTVGILGLGALGAATGKALTGLGFRVAGWSRTPKDLPGIHCHHGAAGLEALLAEAEILCVILPLTAETENVLDARAFARMPKGARIINAGRGPLIDDAALLDALASGKIDHATLDVFRREPLPAGDPFWSHPKVTVTPHIAAVTRPATGAQAIADQISRHLAGDAVQHIVDVSRGY